MRIHIAYVQGAFLREYEKAYVPMFSKELRENAGDSGFRLETEASRADLIILWEGFQYKTPEYVKLLENDPLVRNHAERVYAINYDDHPEGFLAGIYTSLEDPFFDPKRHRIWPFFLMNNPRVYDLTREDVMRDIPSRLFSFTGAISHEVRQRLFALFPKPSQEHYVEHVKRWYDHGEDDRLKFARVALDSVFCLCPHGYCSYTPRITEIMALARVPVIIADDWIPFSFDDDRPYYLRVLEKDVEHLPEILSARRAEADQYRLNARTLWEKYFSPERRVVSTLECIRKLAEQTRERATYSAYRDHWNSREFLSKLGWNPWQKLAFRIEQHVRRWWPSAQVPGVSALMRYRNAPNLN